MPASFYTQSIDGYRWKLTVWEGIFRAQAQQRMTDDSGRTVYRLVGIPAFFDDLETRSSFVESSHAKSWAEKWKRPVMEYHGPALSGSP
ncbi:MAG: hypothetical protein ACJ74Z_22215 [Bryobacteraceae bacterium]|jgi:hypothetical protein